MSKMFDVGEKKNNMEGEFDLALSSLLLKAYSDKLTVEYLERIKEYDYPTYIHSLNCGLYTALMCLNYDFHEDYSKFIVRGGMLHDIGKLNVPKSILDKEGTLTPEEYNVVKTHVKRKYLDNIPTAEFGHIVEQIIFMHHERVNGTGYPHGFKRNDLPIHVRIVQVADSFAAMTEKRPYGHTYTHTDAIKELRWYDNYDKDCIDCLETALCKMYKRQHPSRDEFIKHTILSWT